MLSITGCNHISYNNCSAIITVYQLLRKHKNIAFTEQMCVEWVGCKIDSKWSKLACITLYVAFFTRFSVIIR